MAVEQAYRVVCDKCGAKSPVYPQASVGETRILAHGAGFQQFWTGNHEGKDGRRLLDLCAECATAQKNQNT